MTLQSDASRGWPIAEAVERAAPPDQWDAWIAAEAAWKKASTPIPSGPSAFIRRSLQEIQQLANFANNAFKNVRDHLWKLLESERLVATGSREGPAAQPTAVHSLAWRSLVWPKIENSIVRERYGAKTKIYNVRVFPPIYASDAPSRLNGLSLSEAFRKFVLEDPEVVALSERVMRVDGHERTFRDGEAPGPISNFCWRLGASGAELASDFVKQLYVGPDQNPSSDVLAVANVLSSRLEILRRTLAEGSVVALGTFAKTGAESPISRRQWAREGVSIDVRNSDLCEEENHKLVPYWTGIEFELPTQALDRMSRREASSLPSSENSDIGAAIELGDGLPSLQSRSVQPNAPPPAKAKSAQRESIDEAVGSIWPEGIPKGLTKGRRNQLIIDWQTKNGRAVVSEMTIRRELNRRKNSGS